MTFNVTYITNMCDASGLSVTPLYAHPDSGIAHGAGSRAPGRVAAAPGALRRTRSPNQGSEATHCASKKAQQ